MEVLNDPERGQDTVKLAWPTAVEIEARYEDEIPNSAEPLHLVQNSLTPKVEKTLEGLMLPARADV